MKILERLIVCLCVACAAVTAPQAREIIEERGKGRVTVVKYNDDSWELRVGGKPYFVKGVMFCPAMIGESPHEKTMRDWMYIDDNDDGVNDLAYQTWVDGNYNNKKDPGEEAVGDFQLLKEMGCNTIRLYHEASDNPVLGKLYKNPGNSIQFDHAINKKLLNELHSNYGIMVVMGNFLGSWTIGSGASWSQGTDYSDPAQRENMKNSVKAMVLDNKDEPYVLMWMLGNENNLGSWTKCNAGDKPAEYAKFIGELADMIHELDPDHPVAVCDGDRMNTIKEYAKYATGVDIMAYNSYRGKNGFGALWAGVRSSFDRPVLISEYGTFSYNTEKGEDEDMQSEYDNGCWKDIVKNTAENGGTGNSIGGIVFDWVDRWYMDGSPYSHNPGSRYWASSPDNRFHEEWFGIMSMGNGTDPLMRQKRKAYHYYKGEWN